MAYPTDKPTGSYELRTDNFAELDSKKIPMDDYLFKNGYKNAEESEVDSVPDAHEQNWLFDLLHRNLRYTLGTAEENKRLLQEKVATPTSIGQVKIGYGLEITSNGTLSVIKGVAEDANIVSYDLPVGSYMFWAGTQAPEYFIEPSGQTLLREQYTELWEFAQSNNLVGTLFGEGDGETTFTVTDIRGDFISIADSNEKVGKFTEAGLPDHAHNLIYGRRLASGNDNPYTDFTRTGLSGTTAYASESNPIYGKNDTVMPANWGLKIILKALPTPPSNAVPTGTILDYTGTNPPDGYIIANGAELSRKTFSQLFQWAVANDLIKEQSEIPTTPHGYYGSGDGSTTFTIPDLRGVNKTSAIDTTEIGKYTFSGVAQDIMLPDYSRTYGIPSGFVATESGWLSWYPREGDRGTSALYVNGVTISSVYHYKYRNDRNYNFIVKKGDTITFTSNSSVNFVPSITQASSVYNNLSTVNTLPILKY